MTMQHDYKKYPELTNRKMATEELVSPHIQIKEDFKAVVKKVTDGDTIRVDCDFRDFEFPVRFLDIDAPEMNEPNGKEVREWLKGQIEGEEIEIKIDKNNRVGKWGRLLGKVFHAGMDMGQVMLRMGMAVPFGTKEEHKIPSANKVFSTEQWF